MWVERNEYLGKIYEDVMGFVNFLSFTKQTTEISGFNGVK
jgi:hypothetical protein